jgi:hypothetical protein
MDVGCQEHEKCFAAQNGSPENCGAFGPVNGNKNDTSLENWFPYSAEELNRLERENAALRAELEGVRKDAERYRWPRDGWHVASVYGHEYIEHGWRGETDKMKEMLEVAIDAATAQGKA